jgi:chromosome partitioning protein
MTAKIVSLINLKGGVAKTTTTVQLAECLASEFSKKVLVIDLDPQTNATVALIGEEKWDQLERNNQTIFHLFNDKLERTSNFKIEQAIQKGVSNLNLEKLSLLPSSIRLIEIQDRIPEIYPKSNNSIDPMTLLKDVIDPKRDEYDYILIDCPPNLGLITKNGIEISDYYLIPTISDLLSVYGLPQIVKTIAQLTKDRKHLRIKCLGLVITKYQSNSTRHRNVRAYELPARFNKVFKEIGLPPAPIFKTVIPQANQTAAAMDFETSPNTFKEKYGYSQAGNIALHEYVTNLTTEFMKYVGR